MNIPSLELGCEGDAGTRSFFHTDVPAPASATAATAAERSPHASQPAVAADDIGSRAGSVATQQVTAEPARASPRKSSPRGWRRLVAEALAPIRPSPQLAAQCAAIFGWLDPEGNGYADLTHMQALARETGGEITQAEFGTVCELVGCDPAVVRTAMAAPMCRPPLCPMKPDFDSDFGGPICSTDVARS
eukprot:SAG11_NODE_1439_length_4907_cov_2.082571_3_plen_189_part_00